MDYSKEAFQINYLSVVIPSANVIDAWSNFKTIFGLSENNIAPIKEVLIKQTTEL